MPSPTRQILTSVSLLMLTLMSLRAQPADEYFHGGAQRYLSNNIPGALEVVTNGLQRFPEDEKLKKLYELLNQQQQQQQQKQDEKKDQQSKNDQPKKDEEKKKQEQEKKDQQKQSADKSKDKPDEKKEQEKPQQVAAHQMTPQEAKQLLDAQKDDEQVLIFQPQGEPKNRTKQLKDW